MSVLHQRIVHVQINTFDYEHVYKMCILYEKLNAILKPAMHRLTFNKQPMNQLKNHAIYAATNNFFLCQIHIYAGLFFSEETFFNLEQDETNFLVLIVG